MTPDTHKAVQSAYQLIPFFTNDLLIGVSGPYVKLTHAYKSIVEKLLAQLVYNNRIFFT